MANNDLTHLTLSPIQIALTPHLPKGITKDLGTFLRMIALVGMLRLSMNGSCSCWWCCCLGIYMIYSSNTGGGKRYWFLFWNIYKYINTWITWISFLMGRQEKEAVKHVKTTIWRLSSDINNCPSSWNGWTNCPKVLYIYEQRKIFVTSSNWRGVPTSFSSPVWFLKAWPRTPLPYRVCIPCFFLTGWAGWLGWLAAGWVAGWLAGAWLVAGWLAGGVAGWVGLAGWMAWLAGCWLAGWLYILYDYGWLVFDGCGLPGFMGMNLTSYWTSYLYCPWICICCIGYINEKRWT